MNSTYTAFSTQTDSTKAGAELARAIRTAFGGAPADAIALFASSQHDYGQLLDALAEGSGTEIIVGSSSAGEFTDSSSGQGHACALALRSQDMRFSIGLGQQVSRDAAGAARRVVAGFAGVSAPAMPYRSALVMTDALAGHTDVLVEELTVATGGNYSFFGGGAGDDGRFQKTHVFAGTQAFTDAVVALEIQSLRPLGVGVSHGWEPASPPLRVTEASGALLIGLNGAPAVQAMQGHAEATGQTLNTADPMPFFLHNIIGIKSEGGHRLRVPLGIHADGSISCAAEVPTGAVVQLMRTSQASAVRAAEQATRAAVEALGGRQVGAALVFDCVATRMRLGRAFEDELGACARLLEPARFVGCNTYGQIARAQGQFSGFHNCTAVVCVFPQ